MSRSRHKHAIRHLVTRPGGSPRYQEVTRDPANEPIAVADTRTGKWVVPFLDGAATIGALPVTRLRCATGESPTLQRIDSSKHARHGARGGCDA
jgi:hypothetical protein